MKIRPILFYAWIVYILCSLYAIFKTKVEYHLFTINNYSFGLSALNSNIPMKIVFLILVFATFIQANNIKKEEKIYNT